MQYRYEMESPVGRLRLFSNGDALTGVYFDDHRPEPKDDQGRVEASPFSPAIAQLQQYFIGERDTFDLPVSLSGTEFQLQVWEALQQIQPGETVTYSDIAQSCGRPKSSRAVGAAVGRNPVSIIVPCHRVIGASGSLTGFAGGIARKQWLLQREGVLAKTG